MSAISTLPIWAILVGFWALTGIFISVLVLVRIRKVSDNEDFPEISSIAFGIAAAIVGWPLLINQLVNDALPNE